LPRTNDGGPAKQIDEIRQPVASRFRIYGQTPGSAVFIDTNILIYSSFPGTPFYESARARLSQLESDGNLWQKSETTAPSRSRLGKTLILESRDR
jgi:hypothetical protein